MYIKIDDSSQILGAERGCAPRLVPLALYYSGALNAMSSSCLHEREWDSTRG